MTDRPKTILQVVGAMNMGGVETFLMNVLRNTDKDKYRYVFLCYLEGEYDYTDEIQKLGAKIVHIADTRVINPIKFVKNIESVIENERIDIVHSHVDFSSGYAMIAAKNTGIKSRIIHAHNTSATTSKNIIKNTWLKILKWLMNRYATDRISCGIEAGKFMFDGNTFQIVRNGIDTDRFQFNPTNRTMIRRKLMIDANDVVFLHIGRFENAKNHSFLIDIFNAYHKLNHSSKLILLGDGSLFSLIRHKIDVLNLGDSVYMLGKQANTEDYYSASDLFIMPSLHEGLPVTLVEAQMNSLECLVSNTIDKTVDYGTVDFCPLDKTAQEWSGRIPKTRRKRQPVSSSLIDDYDIRRITNQIEAMYESK